MSRPYRIVVQKVVEQEVIADDHSTLHLKLEPLLPEQQLDRTLGEVLRRRGWTEVAEGVWEKARDEGETMTCDVAAREVTTTITLERKVSREVRRELRGDTWIWREMREMTDAELEALRQREAEKLEAAVSAEQTRQVSEELRAEIARRLDEGEPERRREINRVVLEVLSEALKEKAAELGNVESVDERWDGDEYELTIAVAE